MPRFRRLRNLSTWRAVSLQAWRAPSDPSVYATLVVEADPIEKYVALLREQSGLRVTPTHVVGKAMAIAMRERPDVNAIIRRGRIYVRDTIDVFFQVAFEDGENLAGGLIRRADEKSVLEIAQELAAEAEGIRRGQHAQSQRATALLSQLSPALLRWALALGETLTYDFDLDLGRFGIPYDGFGSCMLTNVASFGVKLAHAPLVPPTRVPFVLTMGVIHEAVVARDGVPAVRRVLPIGVTFDHRLLDGYQAGKLADRFLSVLTQPERELC
jgi:pyruvate dehydrogenase E2 component (dihydrolipoamide acetyltransferase)